MIVTVDSVMVNRQAKENRPSALKKELLAEKVYRGIRTMIADHRWKPGVRLNVQKMARELGVSRTPVWEAVRRLEQERIVYSIPNRGVFMRETSPERSLEVIEVRAALDLLTVKAASSRMADDALSRLAQCLRDQLQAIEREDLVRYSSSDFRFHRLIYEAAGNSYLLELYESINLQMLPTRLNILPALASLYRSHQEILDALAESDSIEAQKAMSRHWQIAANLATDQIRFSLERRELLREAREGSGAILDGLQKKGREEAPTP